MFSINVNILLIILLILFHPGIGTAQELSLHQVNVIGNDINADLEYSFGNIKEVLTDSSGKIFVADELKMKIKVYSIEGLFLYSIGGRGRGPGDFQEMSLMQLDAENNLLVVDHFNLRITKFNSDGEVLSVYNMPQELAITQEYGFFNQLRQLSESQYLILSNQWTIHPRFSRFNHDELFHIWNRDFSEKLYSFGSFKQLGINGEYARLRMSPPRLGSFVEINQGEIVYSPFYYSGLLYVYHKNQMGNWEFKETVNGYDFNMKPFQEYSQETEGASRFLTTGREFWGRDNLISQGLFKREDGSIVNFIKSRNTDSDSLWDFGVMLFDENLKFISFSILEQHEEGIVPNNQLVRWKDKKGNFYMNWVENDLPVIRIFALESR
jgi:hypothetical protein